MFWNRLQSLFHRLSTYFMRTVLYRTTIAPETSAKANLQQRGAGEICLVLSCPEEMKYLQILSRSP
jgi:hypothetical protein